MTNHSQAKLSTCVTLGSPFSREGPQYPVNIGTRGSLKYYDPGPHFPMIRNGDPGSPFSYDTGLNNAEHETGEST